MAGFAGTADSESVVTPMAGFESGAGCLPQPPGLRIAMPVGDFRFQNPGGAGAEKYANAARPEARRTARDGLDEAILSQPQPREAIVAALELRKLRRQWLLLEPRHLTDVGI